ncbi:DNA replication checkpoint protein tel2 [Leucoagaricus sp. SymC.cos]|nr:DNA replication checkpoint protein tel2 [Leucoagaricus sp. SymC.cos]
MTDNYDKVKNIIVQLQQPIDSLQILLSLLTAPLDNLGLLPPAFRSHNTTSLPPRSVNVRKHISPIQRALIEHIYPTWDTVLRDHKPDATALVKQYFCPDAFVNALPVSGHVALTAYETLLSSSFRRDSIQLLESLAREYPIDRLWTTLFEEKLPEDREKNDAEIAVKNLDWEDSVRDTMSVPAKVANAIGSSERGSDIPPLLENATYVNTVCKRVEVLAERMSRRPIRDWTNSLSYLVTKLANVGAFPQSPPTTRSQPSFWQTNLPIIRQKFSALPEREPYCLAWRKLILGLPSSLTLRSALTSLCHSLDLIRPSTDVSSEKRAQVKAEAQLLAALLGDMNEDEEQLWETATSLILSRDWEESYARIFVCWVAGYRDSQRMNTKALRAFLELVVDAWSNSEHIKHSLLSRHRYLTSLFLLTASYFPPSSRDLEAVVFSGLFMQGIGIYISHLDTAVRRCGMLVAETIATMTNKKLSFDGWDGDDSGKPWCRQMRELIKNRDVDADLTVLEAAQVQPAGKSTTSTAVLGDQTPAITKPSVPPAKATFITPVTGYDSDDSLTGYASPGSSRSASPTPSELEEIEKDPTLNVGVKKVARPVYLAQLGHLIRGTGKKLGADEPHEADKVEMALNCGEELIRKKRDYGTELAENAVNLVYGFLALHDNFDLPDFDEKRQGAMNALIACAPRNVAPALIEEFFKNQYSVDQRNVVLTALAVGARELASLPVPASLVPKEKTRFPSKMLPGSLHHRYLAASHTNTGLLPMMVEDISRKAIDRGKEAAEEKVPEIVREKRLKINRGPTITEVKSSASSRVLTSLQSKNATQVKHTTFTEVAAEFFIGPLINRFWLFLRDEQTREERTSYREGRFKYQSVGTGLILNPLVLSQFLRTLAILMNASQNAPEWLAILAPDSLELAVTIGTRPISHMEIEDDVQPDDPMSERERKEAAVLTAALELALIVLDGCMELDGGKSLGLDHTNLLFGVGEWAEAVFANLEKGLRVEGGGGLHEVKLQAAAAGVLLKVDELRTKWRRSMIDTR